MTHVFFSCVTSQGHVHCCSDAASALDQLILASMCRELGATALRDSAGEALARPLTVAGPMWTGPLHSTKWLSDMFEIAERKGWAGHAFSSSDAVKTTGHNPPQMLEQLLSKLLQESDTRLPPWFVTLRDVARVTGQKLVSRNNLVCMLRDHGFAACSSHVEVRSTSGHCDISR